MKIEPHPPLISVKQESRLKCQGCVRSRKVKSRSLLAALHIKLGQVAQLDRKIRNNSDRELIDAFEVVAHRARAGASPESLEVLLFALVREASRRTIGLHPYETQVLAALAMRRRKVIQMNTGEGKTLVAPFVAITEAIYGRRCVVVTANPYLSARDADWMKPLYSFFGISVGSIEKHLSNPERYQEYGKTVAYVAGQDLLFDYLRKHNALVREHDMPISRAAAILDEIDNVLIDNGSRSYSIVQPIDFRSGLFDSADVRASTFRPGQHFEAHPSSKTLELTLRDRTHP